MKFLKNIAMAALVTTALSAGAMAAIDFEAAKGDLRQTLAALKITGDVNADATIELTDDIIKGRAAMKTATTGAHATAAKYLEAVSSSIDQLVTEAGGEAELIKALATASDRKFKISKAKGTLPVSSLKGIFDTGLEPVKGLLFTPSKMVPVLKAKLKVYEDIKFIDPSNSDAEVTFKDIIARYDSHKTTAEHAADDRWVQQLTSDGETFDDVIKSRRFVDPAHAADFHAVRAEHEDALSKAVTKEHKLAFDVMGLLEKNRDELGLKSDFAKATAQAIYDEIYARIAAADTFEADVDRLTRENTALRAAGAPGGTMPGLGGKGGAGGQGGGKAGKPKMTKRQVQDHMDAEGLGGSHAEVAASLGAELVD